MMGSFPNATDEISSTEDDERQEQTAKSSRDGEIHEPPPHASFYLKPEYWDERFVSEDHYEWFKGYSHFRHLMALHVRPTDTVLELGCGSSQMCEELYKDGITQITCIDLSAVAIEKMQKRLTAKGYHGIKVVVADMLKLPFESESFDVIVEKGTMDVLLVDSGDPWNPNSETVSKVNAMLDDVHRVLMPEGIFISISFGQPHFRRPLFEANGFTWSMRWTTFGDGFHYFFYTLKKGTRTSTFNEDRREESFHDSATCLLQEHLDSEDYLLHTHLVDDSELEV